MTDIEAIEARLAAAESGPWRWVLAYQCRGTHWCLENDASAATGSTINHHLVTLSTEEYEYDDEGTPTRLDQTPDFELIAHAPTDIRLLLDALAAERKRADQLQTELAETKEALEGWKESTTAQMVQEGIRQLRACDIEMAQLRQALAPFAEAASLFRENVSDAYYFEGRLTVGDLRRARDVVNKPKAAYDPAYGDDKVCQCSHPYYRHFDTHEEMAPVGCKYCECRVFRAVSEANDEKAK